MWRNEAALKQVLVTGATGFIGGSLCKGLLDRGFEVVGVDVLTDSSDKRERAGRLNLLEQEERFSFCTTDLVTDTVPEIAREVDTVFHVASNVDESGEKSTLSAQQNEIVNATASVIRSFDDVRFPTRFVHVSSHFIYGTKCLKPAVESDRCTRRNVLAHALRKAENLSLSCSSEMISPICVRLFPTYGPTEPPTSRTRRLITQILRDEVITVAGQGAEVADLTYIDDTVSGLIAAGANRTSGLIVNLGGGARVSQIEVLDHLRDLNGGDIRLRFSPESRGRWHTTVASVTLANKLLGFNPIVSLFDGLSAEFEWLKAWSNSPSPRRLLPLII